VNSHIISEPKTEAVNEVAAQSSNVQRMFDEVAEEKAEKETALEQKTVVVDTRANSEKYEKPQSELQLTLSEDIGEYNIIGQLFNTYILVEYKDNFLLIDQHAAHERLNTNRLLKEVEESRVEKQVLLMPYVLKLTPEDFTIALENAETFNELGFELEEFGASTIRVNTVPQLFGEGNLQSFFMDTLDAIKSNPKLDARKDKIFQNACKHSIKAGDRLSNEQIKELIKESLEDNSPLNCPHGRSIVLIKTKREIEKWFNRIV
ncbi:MAG: hypothetical protein IJR47_00340, partial [Clostridia bacterium]|nr:hypothetical protein [Clostridia bacterium]